jgi:CTP synthase
MAASPTGCACKLDWVDSEIFEQPDTVQRLEGVHGILVPGGFGERGTEGKIAAVQFARERGCRSSASASACRWR